MPVFGVNTDTNSNSPVDKVKVMRGQGLDNNQIIQSLQREGLSSNDIFDALNQSDMASGGNIPLANNNMPENAQSVNNLDEQGIPAPGDMGGVGMMPPPSHVASSYSGGDVSTEELVEAIIDEKWNELLKDVNKIVDWKNKMNTKITLIDQKFSDLKSEFDKIHTAILGKIDDYDKNITNVGAEVRAMEKVFSKVLPVFTENVSELSKISKSFKSQKPKK